MVLDMVMAGGDGFTVLSQAVGSDPKPRVVVLSVVDQVDTAVKAIRLGASEYVIKPCNLDELKSALQRGASGPHAA